MTQITETAETETEDEKHNKEVEADPESLNVDLISLLSVHTGLEALPSKKKWSIDGTGVPGFLRPVW